MDYFLPLLAATKPGLEKINEVEAVRSQTRKKSHQVVKLDPPLNGLLL